MSSLIKAERNSPGHSWDSSGVSITCGGERALHPSVSTAGIGWLRSLPRICSNPLAVSWEHYYMLSESPQQKVSQGNVPRQMPKSMAPTCKPLEWASGLPTGSLQIDVTGSLCVDFLGNKANGHRTQAVHQTLVFPLSPGRNREDGLISWEEPVGTPRLLGGLPGSIPMNAVLRPPGTAIPTLCWPRARWSFQ